MGDGPTTQELEVGAPALPAGRVAAAEGDDEPLVVAEMGSHAETSAVPAVEHGVDDLDPIGVLELRCHVPIAGVGLDPGEDSDDLAAAFLRRQLESRHPCLREREAFRSERGPMRGIPGLGGDGLHEVVGRVVRRRALPVGSPSRSRSTAIELRPEADLLPRLLRTDHRADEARGIAVDRSHHGHDSGGDEALVGEELASEVEGAAPTARARHHRHGRPPRPPLLIRVGGDASSIPVLAGVDEVRDREGEASGLASGSVGVEVVETLTPLTGLHRDEIGGLGAERSELAEDVANPGSVVGGPYANLARPRIPRRGEHDGSGDDDIRLRGRLVVHHEDRAVARHHPGVILGRIRVAEADRLGIDHSDLTVAGHRHAHAVASGAPDEVVSEPFAVLDEVSGPAPNDAGGVVEDLLDPGHVGVCTRDRQRVGRLEERGGTRRHHPRIPIGREGGQMVVDMRVHGAVGRRDRVPGEGIRPRHPRPEERSRRGGHGRRPIGGSPGNGLRRLGRRRRSRRGRSRRRTRIPAILRDGVPGTGTAGREEDEHREHCYPPAPAMAPPAPSAPLSPIGLRPSRYGWRRQAGGALHAVLGAGTVLGPAPATRVRSRRWGGRTALATEPSTGRQLGAT